MCVNIFRARGNRLGGSNFVFTVIIFTAVCLMRGTSTTHTQKISLTNRGERNYRFKIRRPYHIPAWGQCQVRNGGGRCNMRVRTDDTLRAVFLFSDTYYGTHTLTNEFKHFYITRNYCRLPEFIYFNYKLQFASNVLAKRTHARTRERLL